MVGIDAEFVVVRQEQRPTGKSCYTCHGENHTSVECPFSRPHHNTLKMTYCGDHSADARQEYITKRNAMTGPAKHQLRYHHDAEANTEPVVYTIETQTDDDDQQQETPTNNGTATTHRMLDELLAEATQYEESVPTEDREQTPEPRSPHIMQSIVRELSYRGTSGKRHRSESREDWALLPLDDVEEMYHRMNATAAAMKYHIRERREEEKNRKKEEERAKRIKDAEEKMQMELAEIHRKYMAQIRKLKDE